MERHRFIGVAADAQTYRNILYLLLAFPLGTFYFVFLVTGISVGVGLIVLALVGIPILIGVVIASRTFMAFERSLASDLLGIKIPPIAVVPAASGGWWARLTALRRDRVTRTGMAYLLLKFPVGIATFTVAITLISTSVGLAAAPTYMWASDELTWGDWTFDPFPWSWILVPIGIALVFVSLHLMNAMAEASGRWTRGWLSGPESQARESTETEHSETRQDDADACP